MRTVAGLVKRQVRNTEWEEGERRERKDLSNWKEHNNI